MQLHEQEGPWTVKEQRKQFRASLRKYELKMMFTATKVSILPRFDKVWFKEYERSLSY
jgi:hypothetical protein